MADVTPKILVPIGFSEQSLVALEQAVVFAKAMKAKIVMVSILSDEKSYKELFKGIEGKDKIKDAVRTKLEELKIAYSSSTGLEFDYMVAEGTIYEEIARITEQIGAGLVIMGTNGKPQNLKKRFIGSNAYRTVTTVDPPVITIKGVRNIDEIKTIIFPLVLDRRSKEKVGPALHYARLFNAQIKVVSILNKVEDNKMIKSHMQQVEKFITDHGITCTSQVIVPETKGTVRNVLEYAYQNKGDLLIITEDEKDWDLTDFFISSDVQSMIYHSEIPVMCVTPSKLKYEAMWLNQ